VNYADLLAYLDANWVKTTLREPVSQYAFDELRALLGHFGHPDRELRVVGVTGSKGKGSIASLTAGLLQAHGQTVGLFTGPHLARLEERARLDGQIIPPEELAPRFGEVLEVARCERLEAVGIFAILLVAALTWFRDQGANSAVLEVRSGGRFDPTAVARAEVVCIGPIGLEHVPGLGYTRAEIAWQKVGLVKPNSHCLSAEQPADAAEVISRECAALGAPLETVGKQLRYAVSERGPRGQRVSFCVPASRHETRELGDVWLGLLGQHQAANALLALRAAQLTLARVGRELDDGAVRRALASARWPGRLDRLAEQPLVLFDGAHTAESARALARALGDHFPGQRWSVVLGLLASKPAEELLAAIAPLASALFCVPVMEFTAYAPDELAALARAQGLRAECHPNLAEALEAAAQRSEPICVTGSLYLYAGACVAVQALGWSGEALSLGLSSARTA
jgi:dihydrofolate synthase/folylpolyglutamate synthase